MLETSLGGAAPSLEAGEALHRDLGKLQGWAISNCIKFNRRKCNPGSIYRLGNERLESSPAEKDVGLLADGKFNLS